MGHHSEAFVDTSKSCNAIAIADGGRAGEVGYLGEFSVTEAALRKLVAKLVANTVICAPHLSLKPPLLRRTNPRARRLERSIRMRAT